MADWSTGMKFPKRPSEQVSQAEGRKLLAADKRKPRHKFNAVRTRCQENHPHPSMLESSVCDILHALLRRGVYRSVKWQATVHLTKRIRWKVDFEVEAAPGVLFGIHPLPPAPVFWVEPKGKWSADARLKCELWEEGYGPGPLQIWKAGKREPYLEKTIYPKERAA